MNNFYKRDREKESLESYLTRLIAKTDNIREEDVTVEYIEKQRNQLIYPEVRHEIGSDYGGYDGSGLTFYTRRELDEMEESVDSRLRELIATA